MKIMLGDYELVESGVVIQIKDIPIKITLPDEVEGDFTFIFTFFNDPSINNSLTRYSSTDKFTLSIEMINFDGAINTGNTNLLTVGTLYGSPLFLNYRVTDLKKIGKTLTFNFYTGKEIKHAN